MTPGEMLQRLGDHVDRTFTAREIIFRANDKVQYVRISSRLQKALAILTLATFGWMVYSTTIFFRHDAIVAARDAEIEEHKLAYFDLLAEVSEYHTQFSRITQNLEENQDLLLSLLDNGSASEAGLADIRERLNGSEDERARVVLAREALRDRLDDFETDLQDIAAQNGLLQGQVTAMRDSLAESEAERAYVAEARERLGVQLQTVEERLAEVSAANGELHAMVATLDGELTRSEIARNDLITTQGILNQQIARLDSQLATANTVETELSDRLAVLEDDLEVSVVRGERLELARDGLQNRLNIIEARVAENREAQISIVARLRERTQASIDAIENTVEITGLDVEDLLAELETYSPGQGGPFVEVDSLHAQVFNDDYVLETSFSELNEQIDRWEALENIVAVMPVGTPLGVDYRVTSDFGYRRDPVNGQSSFHQGYDMAAPLRTEVHATGPGTVIFAGWKGFYGRLVEIDHGNGLTTRYGHLREILVESGDEVALGTVVGLLGSSGRSTGPHVHYEVRFEEEPMDPLPFMEAGRYVLEE